MHTTMINLEDLESKFPRLSYRTVKNRILRLCEAAKASGLSLELKGFSSRASYVEYILETPDIRLRGDGTITFKSKSRIVNFRLWHIFHEPDSDFDRRLSYLNRSRSSND